MAGNVEERTILARPLSLPIDEKKVQTLFSQYGRVIRVRLRYCQTSLTQKESAYIEFADEAAAAQAIRKPPRELNGKKRMAVTLKSAREQRVQQLGGVEQGHRDSPSASAHTVLGKRMQRSDSADDKAAGDVDASQPSDAPGEEDAPSGWGPPSPKRRKGGSGSQQQELKAALAAMTAQAEEHQVSLAQEQAKNEQLVKALQEAHQARDGAVAAERRLQAQVMQQKQEVGLLQLKVEQAQAAARAARDEAHQAYGRRLQ
eukprot:jgi/Astpho2/9925/Aster-06632